MSSASYSKSPSLAMATTEPMKELAEAARRASRGMGLASTERKDRALGEMADALRARQDLILAANAEDVDAARAANKGAAFVDRLLLDADRVAAMARAVEAVAELP